MALTNPIVVNTTITQADLSSYAWPLTVSGSAYVTLGSSLVFTDVSSYFIIGTSGVVIDGSINTVDISGVVNYPGLVRNGTSTTNGYSNTTIQNLGITTRGSTTLAANQGWVGQQYYSRNASGNIIQNCYSTGNISNGGCGGIFGSQAGNNYGTATSTNCYTTGAISGNVAGGIFGQQAGSANGTATSTNSYTTGAISGNGAGGIFGPFAGQANGTATSTNCYTRGAISGNGAGGIFGQQAGLTNGTARANNCFAVGNMSPPNTGGIFGLNPELNVFANNCFVVSSRQTKDSSNNFVPGIFANSPGRPDQSNCIVSSYWNVTDASNTLNYGLSPSTWITQTDLLGQPAFYKLASNPDTIARNIAYFISTRTLDNIIPDGSFSWPIVLLGGSQSTPMVLTLGANRIFPDANHYFIIGSNYITIDGSGKTIDISGVSNYPGIVQNGSSATSKAFSNTTVQNIRATTKGGSYLATGGGWIGQTFYGVSGQMNTFQHCSSTGVIGLDASSTNCGGIVGQAAGGYGGQLVVFNCSSSGNITGTGSGGIAGPTSGRDGGLIDVSNCYSTGKIAGLNAGGIFGRAAGQTSGMTVATNCYALGQIDASGGGGIFGSFAGNATTVTANTKGRATAYNCYYDGSINHIQAGGIFGSYPGGDSVNDGSLGTLDISSCYVSLTYPTVAPTNAPGNTYLYGINRAVNVSKITIVDSSYTTNGWQNNVASQCLKNIGTGGGRGYIWNASGQTLTAAGGTPYTLTAFNPLPDTMPPTLGSFTIPSKQYGDASFTITDPSSNSAGAFTYASSNSNIATVSGNVITVVDIGTATITATQAAYGSYLQGTIDASFTVNTITQITSNNTVFDQYLIQHAYSWPVALETSTETPTTIVFNGSIQLTPASTHYFIANGQTVSLTSNSQTGASITNTDTTANSLFRGK